MYFNNKRNRQSGFTLIELLVVIAIIGTLSSIVLAAVGSARIKARDAKRMAEIKEINKAIQMYIIDNGRAPHYDSCGINVSCLSFDRNAGDWNDLAQKLKPYISNLPKDPCGEKCDKPNEGKYFLYEYVSPGPQLVPADAYKIWASNLEGKLEPFGVTMTADGLFSSN